eukprot:3633911-Pleurochrysis_carterae.AAC.1
MALKRAPAGDHPRTHRRSPFCPEAATQSHALPAKSKVAFVTKKPAVLAHVNSEWVRALAAPHEHLENLLVGERLRALLPLRAFNLAADLAIDLAVDLAVDLAQRETKAVRQRRSA